MLQIQNELRPRDLQAKIQRLWEISAPKLSSLFREFVSGDPPPAFTVGGRYQRREGPGWSLLAGSALLQYDAFWDESYLRLGREAAVRLGAPYLTHGATHLHGYLVMPTYGNLWRLQREGRLFPQDHERQHYEIALRTSGAVQAQRWTYLANGEGFLYSTHGPHSLLAEAIRSLRSLGLAHRLGQVLYTERDEKISLLRRLVEHARSTAKWAVYYGSGRDLQDVRGRAVEECFFNIQDGSYQGAGSRLGVGPASTNLRALATLLLGFAEQLEFLDALPDVDLEKLGAREGLEAVFLNAARALADYYLAEVASDGIPYWDTGAPGLVHLGDYRERPADPFNEHEPVDTTAAVLAAQGLLRLGTWLTKHGHFVDAERYWQAGLSLASVLFAEPYLSTDPQHEGVLLHTFHSRPGGWESLPVGRKVPSGESSLLGDYHLRELALYVQRHCEEKPYLAFFGTV